MVSLFLTQTHTHTHRERERERERHTHTDTHTHTSANHYQYHVHCISGSGFTPLASETQIGNLTYNKAGRLGVLYQEDNRLHTLRPVYPKLTHARAHTHTNIRIIPYSRLCIAFARHQTVSVCY